MCKLANIRNSSQCEHSTAYESEIVQTYRHVWAYEIGAYSIILSGAWILILHCGVGILLKPLEYSQGSTGTNLPVLDP